MRFSAFQRPLLENEDGGCTDEYEYGNTYAEIGNFAADIPLRVRLAEHGNTGQRNQNVDRLCPNIKYLQNRQNNNGKADEHRCIRHNFMQ